MAKCKDWKTMYMILVDGIDKAINELENVNVGKAREILIESLQKAEDEYINQN